MKIMNLKEYCAKNACLLLAGMGSITSAVAQDFKYDPLDKPDPFRPMMLTKPSVQSTSELQEFDLNDLNLVGTLLGGDPSALLMTPNQQGIIARIGDKIGKKNGHIIVIARDKIVVRQPVTEKILSTTLAPGASRQRFEDISLALTSRSVTDKPVPTPGIPMQPGFLGKQLPASEGAVNTNQFGQIRPGDNPQAKSSGFQTGSTQTSAQPAPTNLSFPANSAQSNVLPPGNQNFATTNKAQNSSTNSSQSTPANTTRQ